MKIRVFKYNFYAYFREVEKRQGVCSQKDDKTDCHMLLWDFDKTPIGTIIIELRLAQIKYKLPSIYIVQSSKGSYHAYCFTARTFRETINVLSSTPHIDLMYLRLGIARGYHTLRFSDRNDDKIQLVEILKSSYKDEMRANEITVNTYFTTNLGGK